MSTESQMTREQCEGVVADWHRGHTVAAVEVIDALRASLAREAAARDAALDEAVAATSAVAHVHAMCAGQDAYSGASQCVAAVRALKSEAAR